MATYSRRSTSGPVVRSLSPSGRFCSGSRSSSAFASSSAAFSSQYTAFFHRSASPTRVNLFPSPPSSRSVRFAIDHRPTSPGRSIASVSRRGQVLRKPSSNPLSAPPKKTCMCSPTNHPGSFRCSLHKGFSGGSGTHHAVSSRLNARRSAMTNSLVRIGTVEGDWVKRALAALIRPSSHQQKRRAAFQPRPSRLSVMSKAG